jgi:hypothetical protein
VKLGTLLHVEALSDLAVNTRALLSSGTVRGHDRLVERFELLLGIAAIDRPRFRESNSVDQEFPGMPPPPVVLVRDLRFGIWQSARLDPVLDFVPDEANQGGVFLGIESRESLLRPQ